VVKTTAKSTRELINVHEGRLTTTAQQQQQTLFGRSIKQS